MLTSLPFSHLYHCQIYPSLGGWTLSDPFPALAASEKARANFAENCVTLIEEYGFDGIDLDWEYPGKLTEDKKNTLNNSVGLILTSSCFAFLHRL